MHLEQAHVFNLEKMIMRTSLVSVLVIVVHIIVLDVPTISSIDVQPA